MSHSGHTETETVVSLCIVSDHLKLQQIKMEQISYTTYNYGYGEAKFQKAK